MDVVDRTLYQARDWGGGEVWTRGTTLVHHVLAGEDPALADAVGPSPERGQVAPARTALPRNGGARAPTVTLAPGLSRERRAFVTDLCQRFRRHLAGRPVRYDEVEIDLGACTELEAALTAALRGVLWGEVVTYGELAALAGRPGAARAAGSFCAVGGMSLVLPYHRVVAAQGIGGYGPDGVEVKRRLLALEGVRL